MIPGIKLGPLSISYYGIILMSGALAAAWMTAREAKRRGQNPEFVWDALLWVLIGGIVGARLWHVFTPPPSMVERGFTTLYYFTHPLEILQTWNGGLGIPGAVIGGALALYIYARRTGASFLLWADMIAPGLALAQAIGRWGNFVNQELYGMPTTLPWAITIDPAYRLAEYKDVAAYHPLFLYESLFSLANMALLMWLSRRYQDHFKPGDIFLVYLVTYPSARFLLEFLRLDPAQVGGVNFNQMFMLVVALGAAVVFSLRHGPEPRRKRH